MAADNTLTKRAHSTERFSEEQVYHLLACSDKENGPLHYATNFFYIQHPTKGKLLFEPFEYQVELLKSYNTHVQTVNMLPRQSGKCLINHTLIKIKHATTGEELEMPIGEFYKMQQGVH